MAFRINLTVLYSSAFLIWNRDLLVKHCFDCTSHIASPALLDGCYFSHQDKARRDKTRQGKFTFHIKTRQGRNRLTMTHLQKTARDDADGKKKERETERSHRVVVLDWPTTICAEVPGWEGSEHV